MNYLYFIAKICLLLFFYTSCQKEINSSSMDNASQTLSLSKTDTLIRISMALRGQRPSVEQLQSIRINPELLSRYVDEYLQEDSFIETVRDIENESLLMRVERTALKPSDEMGEAGNIGSLKLSEELFEEPLRLIAYIVENNLPYSDIVQADYTIATYLSRFMFEGIDKDAWNEEGDKWQPLGFIDDRKPAGILSTDAFFFRHLSALLNYQRGRANHVSTALLCNNFLDFDVDLSNVNLTDEEALKNAITNDPHCVSCHQTLDPLAGFFWGFAGMNDNFPFDYWKSERAGRGSNNTGRETGYFGTSGETMEDLGRFIANDPRFTLCTARRYFSWMSQVPLNEVPYEIVGELQKIFIESNMSIKALARAIVLHPSFHISHTKDEENANNIIGYIHTRPKQLARMFKSLTGFEWFTLINQKGIAQENIQVPISLVTSANIGFLVMGGGYDSIILTIPEHTYNATHSVFLRNFAVEVAGYVVSTDFDTGRQNRKLLTLVDKETVEESLIREQLVLLHTSILGEFFEIDSLEIDKTWALFSSALRLSNDPIKAWKIVLTAMFQDFKIAYH